jgi:pimeloyl-ACP methyl ester carboxylesterase
MAIAPLSSVAPGCRSIAAAGTELNVLCAGHGRRTVVLLHGFGDTHATWRKVLPTLAHRHRVVALDLPGFGASRSIRGALLDGQVAAIEGVLDALGVDGPVAIVGNSMGGAAALRFALAHPGRTERVVTIAPAGLGVGVPIWWRMLSGQLLSLRLVLLALEVVPPALVQSVARQIFLRLVVHDPTRIDRATLRDLGRRYRTRRDVEDLYQLGHLLVAELASGALLARAEELDVPLLVIWGRQDRMVPVEHGGALTAAVARSRLEVLDGCGHCPQLERPDLLLPLLEGFLTPVAVHRGP